MAKYKRLTTITNPWNPDTQYGQWYSYNKSFYNVDCDSIVDRMNRTAPSFSEPEVEEAYENALNSIVENDILGIFKIIELENVPSERIEFVDSKKNVLNSEKTNEKELIVPSKG